MRAVHLVLFGDRGRAVLTGDGDREGRKADLLQRESCGTRPVRMSGRPHRAAILYGLRCESSRRMRRTRTGLRRSRERRRPAARAHGSGCRARLPGPRGRRSARAPTLPTAAACRNRRRSTRVSRPAPTAIRRWLRRPKRTRAGRPRETARAGRRRRLGAAAAGPCLQHRCHLAQGMSRCDSSVPSHAVAARLGFARRGRSRRSPRCRLPDRRTGQFASRRTCMRVRDGVPVCSGRRCVRFAG